MKNPYKRTDVFRCNYQTHQRFANRVSVYHVLKARNCYPQGCVMFKWSCAKFDKGQSCVRGFKHIGRLCDGCTHYSDEKVNYQPKLALSRLEYERFQSELEDFEDWLQEHQNRDVEFWCTIEAIKPRFKKIVHKEKGQLCLEGYLYIAKRGFIGLTDFDDTFYGYLSSYQQERLKIAPGDAFEARGHLTLDRGRVLMQRTWSIDFETRSGEKTWTNSEALVSKQIATLFKHQPESCLHCLHGALVDVQQIQRDGSRTSRRQLYCLQGIAQPTECYMATTLKMDYCGDHIR